MRAPGSPQFRFLARASALFVALLALWWWLLLPPLLTGIRLTTALALHCLPGGSVAQITVNPEVGWILRVPVPPALVHRPELQRVFGTPAPGSGPVKPRSFKLVLSERTPAFFTVSLPLFWALVLAGPRGKTQWRALPAGTVLLFLLAVLSLLLYTAYTIADTLRLAVGWTGGILGAAEYLNLNILQFLAPVPLALWLHAGLRAQIFSLPVMAAPAPTPAKTR